MFHLTNCAITCSQIKYCMASTICLTNLDTTCTMLQKITRRAAVEFYNFSSCMFYSYSMRATSSILGVEKVQQSLEGAM